MISCFIVVLSLDLPTGSQLAGKWKLKELSEIKQEGNPPYDLALWRGVFYRVHLSLYICLSIYLHKDTLGGRDVVSSCTLDGFADGESESFEGSFGATRTVSDESEEVINSYT
jgi:hypothetical protein